MGLRVSGVEDPGDRLGESSAVTANLANWAAFYSLCNDRVNFTVCTVGTLRRGLAVCWATGGISRWSAAVIGSVRMSAPFQHVSS
jgi:hypothetical protein